MNDMLLDAAERPSLSEAEITALIADPTLIESHEIALEVLDCLDDEIANIQAQVDAAQIESNAKPLSPDRMRWLQRAAYAGAMRRNERHRVIQRDKELRGTKARNTPKDPDKAASNLIKQHRLATEAETRRETKRIRAEELRVQQMALANAKYEMKMKMDSAHRFREVAKRLLPAELYDRIVTETSTGS